MEHISLAQEDHRVCTLPRIDANKRVLGGLVPSQLNACRSMLLQKLRKPYRYWQAATASRTEGLVAPEQIGLPFG